MRKLLIAAAAAIALASPAQAQMKIFAESGAWKALAGLNKEGSPMCSMSLASDVRHIMIKWQASDQGFYLHLVKTTWSIPADVSMPIKVQFDKVTPWDGTAHGVTKAPTMIESTIAQGDNGDTFEKFMGEFMDADKLVISFPGGNEGDWVARMDGSEKVGRAFKRCVSNVRAKATQPYKPTQPYKGDKPTQPHQTAPAPAIKSSPNDRDV